MRNPDVRLANLRLLVEEFGTLAEVGRRAGTSEKYLWQILNGVSYQVSGNPRAVGNRLAEKLESGCGKAPGWMDSPHDTQAMTPEEVAEAFRVGSPDKREVIRLMARLPDDEASKLLPIVQSMLARYE